MPAKSKKQQMMKMAIQKAAMAPPPADVAAPQAQMPVKLVGKGVQKMPMPMAKGGAVKKGGC